MTSIGELLDSLALELAGAGVPPARADARDLIASVLDQPRFWPTAHRDRLLDAGQTAAITLAGERLKLGMPAQYAAGKAAFRHLTLQVDQRVLIPRPETELAVDLLLGLCGMTGSGGPVQSSGRTGGGTVADIGTGSGAIALSVAAEGSFDRIIATDLSASALDVARANLAAIPAERRALIEFREGDLLAPVRRDRLRAIVSNPPYISPSEAGDLPAAVRDWEPHLALFSEEDGMWAVRGILRDAPDVLDPGGVLVMEVDARRATLAAEVASTDSRWKTVELHRDLTGRERFLVARLQER